MTPLVLNKHCCDRDVAADAVDITRSGPWGNLYRIGRDGDRPTVIAKHETWLRGQHHLLKRLDELRGRNLLCVCAPAACHGDLLLWLANASREDRIAWWRGTPRTVLIARADGTRVVRPFRGLRVAAGRRGFGDLRG